MSDEFEAQNTSKPVLNTESSDAHRRYEESNYEYFKQEKATSRSEEHENENDSRIKSSNYINGRSGDENDLRHDSYTDNGEYSHDDDDDDDDCKSLQGRHSGVGGDYKDDNDANENNYFDNEYSSNNNNNNNNNNDDDNDDDDDDEIDANRDDGSRYSNDEESYGYQDMAVRDDESRRYNNNNNNESEHLYNNDSLGISDDDNNNNNDYNDNEIRYTVETTPRLLLSNLSSSLTKAHIKEICKDFGVNVKNLTLEYFEHERNRYKNLAVVEFEDHRQAEKAIELLDGMSCDHMTIYADWTTEKSPQKAEAEKKRMGKIFHGYKTRLINRQNRRDLSDRRRHGSGHHFRGGRRHSPSRIRASPLPHHYQHSPRHPAPLARRGAIRSPSPPPHPRRGRSPSPRPIASAGDTYYSPPHAREKYSSSARGNYPPPPVRERYPSRDNYSTRDNYRSRPPPPGPSRSGYSPVRRIEAHSPNWKRANDYSYRNNAPYAGGGGGGGANSEYFSSSFRTRSDYYDSHSPLSNAQLRIPSLPSSPHTRRISPARKRRGPPSDAYFNQSNTSFGNSRRGSSPPRTAASPPYRGPPIQQNNPNWRDVPPMYRSPSPKRHRIY